MPATPSPPDDPFPEGGDFDSRRDWFARRLEGRAHEYCILIAARAALRVLPNLTYLQQEYISKKSTQNTARTNLLPIMGCHALSAAASLAPAAERERFKAVASLRAGYSSIVDFTLANSSNGDFEPIDGSAAFATNYAVAYNDSIGLAAAAVVRASYAANRAVRGGDTPYIVDAAAYALEDTTYTNAASQSASAVTAFEADLARLDGSHAARERLAASPLWLNEGGAPLEILDNWNTFSAQLRALGDDWDVWVEWYGGGMHEGKAFPGVLQGAKNGRYLFGLPTARALKLWHDVALLPNDLWQGEPADLNAAFKKLVEEARGEKSNPAPAPEPELSIPTNEEDFLAVASPQVFINEKGEIDLRPNPITDTPSDPETWQKLIHLQKEIVEGINASLPRNAPPTLRFAFGKYGLELEQRPTAPFVGTLETMHSVIDADCKSQFVQDWLADGLKVFIETYQKQHPKIIKEIKESSLRKEIDNKTKFDESKVDFKAFEQEINNVLELIQQAYPLGGISSTFYDEVKGLDKKLKNFRDLPNPMGEADFKVDTSDQVLPPYKAAKKAGYISIGRFAQGAAKETGKAVIAESLKQYIIDAFKYIWELIKGGISF